MSRKQTRRSISVRGSTYDQIRSYCADRELSMSEFIEAQVASFFGTQGAAELPKASLVRPSRLSETATRRKPSRSATPQSSSRLSTKELHAAARDFTF